MGNNFSSEMAHCSSEDCPCGPTVHEKTEDGKVVRVFEHKNYGFDPEVEPNVQERVIARLPQEDATTS
jgi:hypothetical protein